MHLIWENLVKNLVLHWTGEFKGLDEGSEDYKFTKPIWEAIGEATATSGSTIPSAFGARCKMVNWLFTLGFPVQTNTEGSFLVVLR